MTRAITALDVVTGGPRKREEQKIWFWREWDSSLVVNEQIFVSPIFKNGVVVHKFKVLALNTADLDIGCFEVAIVVTQNENLTWAGMRNERQIIDFRRTIPNYGLTTIHKKFQTNYEMYRRFEGANLRLAIGFYSSCVEAAYIHAGLLYSEP